jgi:predicted phosphate transport protein (TIGR00153 family)
MKSKDTNKRIDEIAKEYNAQFLEGASVLNEIMKDFITNKLDKSRLDEVIESERKCDRIKEKYIQVLFQDKRALPFLVEDRYKIITLVDEALGKVEFIARFLKIYPFNLYDDISENFKKLCNTCYILIKMLMDTLELMETNFDDAYEKTIEIEKLRRDARKLRYSLLETIYKKTEEPTRVLLTSKLVNNVYNVIAWIEDIADYLRGLIIKYPTR